MLKKMVCLFIVAMVATGLGGCASSYMLKNSNAKAMKQYGIVVSNYSLTLHGTKLPEEAQKKTTQLIEQDAISLLAEYGIEAKPVAPETFCVLLKQYAELPRGRAGISSAGNHNFGDQKELFDNAGIDGLIVISGNTNLWRSSFLRTMGKFALEILAAAITGNAAGGSGPDAVTTMEMSVIDHEGKFVYHFGDYFTYKKGTFSLNKGDILDPQQRKEILGIYVKNYRSAVGI